MKNNVTFVIIGATGDLTKLKLIPAIYQLVRLERLDNFAIIGVARSDIKINEILDNSKKSIKNVDENIWDKIKKKSYYTQVDVEKPEDFENLKDFVQEIEIKEKLEGNRLFYLATLPDHFGSITGNLARSKLVDPNKSSWSRVLYEKPFGNDLNSAKELNKCINKLFDEKHIYRVDHYLGKEIVGNISLLRFTNRILEPLWNNKNIDSIQIILDEDFGIKGRGKYYDKYGTIKDVIQNHALQILALTAMESPKMLTGEYIREEKAKVLEKTRVLDVILGQYEGYKSEFGVEKNSETETFAAIELEIDNSRWKGVPFYIRSGKNLNKKEASIHIKFKEVDCLLAKSCPSDTNYLTIRIQPNEGFEFEINSKPIGRGFEVEPIKMNFSHKAINAPNSPEAYEVLLEDAIEGDQALFVRNDEIEHSWKIVDSINKSKYKTYSYKTGSKGPIEFIEWSKKKGINWKS